MSYALALIPAGLLPATVGLAGSTYFAGALILGLVYLSRRGPVLAGRQRPAGPPAAPYVIRLLARDPAPAAAQPHVVLTGARVHATAAVCPF